jgi:pilus assembly protein CpaE
MKTMVEYGNWNGSSRESLHTGEPLSVVGVSLDEETWRFLNVFANANPLIRIRSQVGSYRSDPDQEAILEQLGDPAPDVCLLDFDRNRRAAVMMAERIHTSLPGTAIFAVSSQSQPNAILEAMRCGCTEYLVKPIDRDQLASAVMRIGGRRKEKHEQNRAQLVAFMGAKGGVGTTTLATQMGALLANTFSRTALLVDLHPDFGDAALYLKLNKAKYHFFELLENTERLDADLLESFVVRHSSGLEMIPAPEGNVLTRDGLPAGALAVTFDFLRPRYEFVLVDLPPALNDDNLTVIRDCDQLYLVAVAEVSAIRNVVRQLEYFERKEIPREKIRVVLNRHSKRNVITDAQIEKVLDQKIYWRVPNQYPQVVKTIHEGDPIAQLSSSEVTRSLRDWAAEIGRKPGSDSKKEGGLLGLWSR